MAQTPVAGDSADLVGRSARRHVRLAKRTGNEQAITLSRRIEPPLAALKAKSTAWDAASEIASDAFDDWEQDDRTLDQLVYSVDRKSTDWDADHAGRRTRGMLFDDEPASAVTGLSREDEPNEVDKIVARGARLEDDHPAKPLLAQLTTRADASRTSHRAYLAALKGVATADAELAQAALDVIATYRDNVHDITRAVGEEIAERCFPNLRKRAKKAKAKPGPERPTAAGDGG
jgi:hypothetical protein